MDAVVQVLIVKHGADNTLDGWIIEVIQPDLAKSEVQVECGCEDARHAELLQPCILFENWHVFFLEGIQRGIFIAKSVWYSLVRQSVELLPSRARDSMPPELRGLYQKVPEQVLAVAQQ